MYDYVEQKGQNRNSCAGCMILSSAILLFLAVCLSMCGEAKDQKSEKQEDEIARYIAEKNLELDKRALDALTQKQFVCYANKVNRGLNPAVSERREALDAGEIGVEQFKANIAMIYDSVADKVFLECVNETK